MDSHTWRGFLRSRKNDPAYRVILHYARETPSVTKLRIEGQAKDGRIPADRLPILLEMLEEVTHAFYSRTPLDYKDPKDWVHINGGVMRRNHMDPCHMEKCL